MLRTILDLGPEAGEAFLQHGTVVRNLLTRQGRPAARALRSISRRNGRRLAILESEGVLGRMQRPEELLDLIARYGDRAMDFVWRNKGTLAISAALAAFLADPDPFLDGTRDVVTVIGEAAERPIAEVPGKLADGAAEKPTGP